VRRLFFVAARASSSLGLPGLLRMGGRVVDMLSLAKACAKDGSMTDDNIIFWVCAVEPTWSHD